MKLVLGTLNDYLRERRIQSGLSQLDVAKKLGYASPQFVSNWERGLVTPPIETIGVLADLYEIPMGQVVDRILNETRTYLESELKSKKARPGAKQAAKTKRPLTTKAASASSLVRGRPKR